MGADDHWNRWARDAAAQGSPLYAALAASIGTDSHLVALTDQRRRGQPRVNLLLAAVHYLLLQGANHELREHYPTLGGNWSGKNLLPLFRDFVCRNETAIRALIATRVTNTNEAARSCLLRAGFAALARHEDSPLHAVELGPSAGLNMVWDRYGMRFHREGEIEARLVPDSPVQLDCALIGDKTPPFDCAPRIQSRIGLERDPVDLDDDLDRQWLRALIWPDQVERLMRLDRAVALFREAPTPIRAGDALALLPDAMAAAAPGAAICVYHSLVAYQFSKELREALSAHLAMAGVRRPLWHLAFELTGQDYLLTLARHRDGTVETQVLARAQAHGGWIEWLAGT